MSNFKFEGGVFNQNEIGDKIVYNTHLEEQMDNKTQVNITNSPGAITNVADYISDVSNQVTQTLNQAPEKNEVKDLVKQLIEQIQAIDPQVNPEKTKQMVDDLRVLAEEMKKTEPRRKWYELSLEGIKEAALSMGAIATPIIETVSKLLLLLVPN